MNESIIEEGNQTRVYASSRHGASNTSNNSPKRARQIVMRKTKAVKERLNATTLAKNGSGQESICVKNTTFNERKTVKRLKCEM